jgi:hypothetical protein
LNEDFFEFMDIDHMSWSFGLLVYSLSHVYFALSSAKVFEGNKDNFIGKLCVIDNRSKRSQYHSNTFLISNSDY